MLRRVSGRYQFNDRFVRRGSPGSKSIGEAEIEVKVVPKSAAKKRNKFALSASSSTGEKAFWEELRDSQARKFDTSLRTPKRRVAIESESAEIMEDLIPVSNSNAKKSVPVIVSNSSIAENQSPLERYLEPSQQLLQLHPSTLALQTEIVNAKSAVEVLALVEAENELLPLTTGLHCVARLCSRNRKKSDTLLTIVTEDHRLHALLERIGMGLNSIGIVGKSNVFWSIVKLGLSREVKWFTDLVSQLALEIPNPNTPTDCLTNTLYTLAELSKIGGPGWQKESKTLADACISTLCVRIPDLTTKDLVSTCISLARLGRPECLLLTALGDRLVDRIDSVSMDELSSVLWAFTTLKLVDSALYSKIQKMLESHPPTDCSKRHLVDLVWALAKGRPSTADHSLSELFRFTLAPLLRTHMMDLSVRELCTVLWSFASAEVVDSDFYNDVAHALIPKGSEMNAHDVSSVVWALSAVQFAQSDLLKVLRRQTLLVKGEMTPLQLSRVVMGFGAAGVQDRKMMESLIDSCRQKMHLLYTQNIVEILIGMSGSGILGEGLEEPFLQTLGTQTDRISGRDAVQILKLLPQGHRELEEQLLEIVKQRFNCAGRWIPNGYDLCDLLEAISRLNVSDPNIIEPVVVHLGTVYKSPSFTAELFLRFLAAVSCFDRFSPASRCLSKLLLVREKGIQVAMGRLSEQLLNHTDSLSVEGGIDILEMYSKIGFQDESVLKLAELLNESLISKSVSPDATVRLASSLGELQIMPDWAFQLAQTVDISQLSSERIVDLVWARLALGDDPSLLPEALLMRLGEIEAPEDSFRGKQVALSLSRLKEPSGFGEKILKNREKDKKRISIKNQRSISNSMDKYEALISYALTELGVKHSQRVPAVRGVYTVTAAIGQKLCIDLVGPEDVVAPRTDRWRGEKILKKIHLMEDGWTVVNITMRQVQQGLESNSLKPVIADLIAPYNVRAKERTSFRPIPENVEKVLETVLDS